MKVCFLLTHIPNPRINKRISAIKKTAETIVVCARRSSQNIWEPSQDVDHIIFDIDLPSAQHIIKRYIVSSSFQKKAIKAITEFKPDVLYVEGLDSLIVAYQYKLSHKIKVIFEVADLRENYISRPKNPLKRIITTFLLWKEQKVFVAVDNLVVTSPNFYELHYKKLIPQSRMLVIPNIPDMDLFKAYKRKNSGQFTIGFIGGIRYLAQMKMLVDASIVQGVNVLFAGAGVTTSEYNEIQRYCKNMSNVIFTGKYNYDSEIVNLYERVDCVYAVYDADNPNVKVALPNKLYESIACGLPIIVAKGTYLAELVELWGVGVSVSHLDIHELEDCITRLKDDSEYYNCIRNNCKVLKTTFNDDWKGTLTSIINQGLIG